MVIPFSGNCPFRDYMPQKRHRYSFKIFALCDVRNSYTYKLEVYCGRQPNYVYQQSKRLVDIVDRLVDLLGTNCHNITIHSWYTSLELAEKLQEKNLMLVGTVRKNKATIPPLFLEKIRRPPRSSIFGFNDNGTLLSYCPQRNKFIILFSIMSAHQRPSIKYKSSTFPTENNTILQSNKGWS